MTPTCTFMSHVRVGADTVADREEVGDLAWVTARQTASASTSSAPCGAVEDEGSDGAGWSLFSKSRVGAMERRAARWWRRSVRSRSGAGRRGMPRGP
jgi:hypothetical protein